MEHDLGAAFDLTAGLWPAGFYNKTFMWPNWHWYEGFIRRAAGLGTVPGADDPDHYIHRNIHCDVLVCGAGPAGLAAASAAARSGARVLLVDQDREAGGSLLWCPAYIDDQPGERWLAERCAALEEAGGILLKGATVTACFDHNVQLIAERINNCHGPSSDYSPRERLWKVRAKEVILATGAIEQPLLFPNNDRPGIMLASALRQYVNRYAVTAGRRVVVATNNDSACQAALDLHNAGVSVECLIDSRVESDLGEGSRLLLNRVRERGITLFQNAIPLDTSGRKGVKSIQVARRDSREASGYQPVATIQCDCVAMSGGWQPAVHLFSQARGKLRYSPEHSAFLPDQIPAHLRVVGAANGEFSLTGALREGHQAGAEAATAAGYGAKLSSSIPKSSEPENLLNTERFTLRHKPQRQWVDFQHDVTLRDIDIAVQENYVSVEHLKRYTTTGMSVDQGKTSNINALAALAERTGRPIGEVGTTTFRPFYTPTTLGAIAGRRRQEFYAPIQRSPLFLQHERLNAEFWDYGSWRRPATYPRPGETLADAIQREALAVRTSVGIFDGSPLGKIEVRGPDAAEFLNRFYINNVVTLGPGQARYGLMLNENGVIIDDGIFARLGEDHYLLHTTSGGAARIHAWLEEWQQCEWPDMDLILTPVTSQWANIAVSGPRAREVLQRLDLSIDLDNNSFPHMQIRTGESNGVPLRILRASYTGELTYEINVPADYGMALWQALMEAGKAFSITPYGIESLMVLRTEKGYLHIGADTDGLTTPADVGWGTIAGKKSADFIGKRSLSRPHNTAPERLQFVGLAPVDQERKITAGAHVVNAKESHAPSPSQGYVTSSCYSPSLKGWIGLGLVKNGRAHMGQTVNLYHDGKTQAATIVEPTFYDPKGERLHA
ncbi:NAD(P)-binding domain-containing protein [Porticoccaceae bacterium]|nr:NAD(P)-binding domain-containing protein [Porticoccaceae bacterium]